LLRALPTGAGRARNPGLTAETAFGTNLAGNASNFGCESIQLVDHRVDGVLQLQDLAANVDGDLLRQVAAGHRRRHLSDVAHLRGQVAGHVIHVVGEVLPDAGYALHLRLATQLAFGADFA